MTQTKDIRHSVFSPKYRVNKPLACRNFELLKPNSRLLITRSIRYNLLYEDVKIRLPMPIYRSKESVAWPLRLHTLSLSLSLSLYLSQLLFRVKFSWTNLCTKFDTNRRNIELLGTSYPWGILERRM